MDVNFIFYQSCYVNNKDLHLLYHSRTSHNKSKKTFQIYTAEEVIAAITQHVPGKSFDF